MGFIGLYKGIETRDHFQNFNCAAIEEGQTPRNLEEIFNKNHSSCRNIIKHTFGVWKSRFHILEKNATFQIQHTADIVIATMVVHNYLPIVDDTNYGFTKVANAGHFEEQDTELQIDKTKEEVLCAAQQMIGRL
ncbi:Uncharacterized protein Adt_30710 [Abeliophyllum distichum]|uniref:DDE Tnp4 domain-containing protein n=1 Tax=Abeliophyllum distichum TaxID=126358 RepID=A0ABD1RD32_9LAMI